MTTSKTPLKDHWESYLNEVLPKNAPEIQKVECRRAFYAGALAIWVTVISGVSEAEEITGSDLLLMNTIKNEFAEYLKELIKK